MSQFGMIDTHAHLLPGVDDGCNTVEESIACAKALAAEGYTHAFCTPHIWANLAGNNVATIPDMVAGLQARLDAAGVKLRLLPGGELNLRLNIMESIPEFLVTYGLRRKYVLVDLWADRLPDHFEPGIRWFQEMGLTVILAHPERLRAVQDEPELADYFASMDILLQGNLGCFSALPTAPTRRVADRYLEEGRYWMLGSDTHGVGGLSDRIAGLRRVRKLVDAETFDRLTRNNPIKLIGSDDCAI